MSFARITAVLFTGALGAACADASDRYRDFSRRAAETGFDGGASAPDGSCAPPPPGSIEGLALLAVENSFGPGLPVLFFGELRTPELSGKTHVVFDYHPLDASDRRTRLGELLHVGPFAIETDGAFVAAMPKQTLPGAANPLLPGVPITSELELRASICGVAEFYCGTVGGRTESPIRGEVAGQFGLTLLPPGETLPPARPRFGCSSEAVAAPLGP